MTSYLKLDLHVLQVKRRYAKLDLQVLQVKCRYSKLDLQVLHGVEGSVRVVNMVDGRKLTSRFNCCQKTVFSSRIIN